jgi:thioredoxin 1
LAVIDYSATWCGPCKIVAPVYRDLAQHYRAIKFLHIDIDHAAETEGLSELVDKIRSVPTFHFYRDGKIIDFLYGGNISQLKIKVDALNTLGAMAAAAAAANEKKSAMIANAAAITAATNAVIAAATASAPLQPKIIEQKQQQQQLPPPQLAPPQEDNKQKLAIPLVIPSDDSKLATSAPGSVASSAAVTPAITNTTTTTTTNATTETTTTINNEQTNNLNPIIDIYNSIDFINVTSNGLALVDYSAVWCPPCVRVQPILKDIAQNYKNIKFVHIDIDHAADTDLAELVDKISSVPTFHFYSEGRVIDSLQGANIAQLRSKVETLSNLNTNAANNLIQPFSNAKIGSDNNNNNNNLTTTTNNNEKKEKKKSKSSDEKKAADKKKKRKSKRKEKEAAAAKSQANNTSVGPITTNNNNNKSQGDATSAATLVSITTNTAKDIVE